MTQENKIGMGRIFQYEIQGSRYSKSKTGLEKGIFWRNTSYFIVIHKSVKNDKSLGLNSNNVIFLWKGNDGLNKNKLALEKFFTTPFKEIKKQSGATNDPALAKRASAFVAPTTGLMKRSSTTYDKVNSGGISKMNKVESVTKIKEILTPIFTGKSKFTGDSFQISNMKSKVSSDECLVSMRWIVTQDNEPNWFTTLFSGSMVVRSFDFLDYGKDSEYGYIMLYQLIGVPHINQKAVEVPVKWESLSSTGLYILLADDNIFFWVSTNYYMKYLDMKKYKDTQYLLSDEML